MKTLKFGGTSVGRPERMKRVAEIVANQEDKCIVVLSALSGTTNSLVEISSHCQSNQHAEAKAVRDSIFERHREFVEGLIQDPELKKAAMKVLDKHIDRIDQCINQYDNQSEKELLAQGELISTQIFQLYLNEIGVSAKFLLALDFMRTDENREPDIEFLRTELSKLLDDNAIYITQGYICKNQYDQVDNLERGGSDYTATLIAAALNAQEAQIWTDIDGMHNNDPRIVENTYPVAELSFDEASELAYFGAKVLHPLSIWPVQKFNVPVRIKNTMDPDARGTLISERSVSDDIKALAAKDGITAIKLKSSRMILAYGFLRKVFEVFERHKTSIDMITTSEIAVSLTIDNPKHLGEIVEELKEFGHVDVDKNQTIICIVGNFVMERKGIVARVMQALGDIPVRMISYGGSRHNISLLIDTSQKKRALEVLNQDVFGVAV